MQVNYISTYSVQKNSHVGFRARMPEKSINYLYSAVENKVMDKAKLYTLLERLDKYPRGYIDFNAKGFGCGGVAIMQRKSVFGKNRLYHVDRAMIVRRQDPSEDILISTQKHEKGSLFDFLESCLVNKNSKMNIKTRSKEPFKQLSIEEYENGYVDVLRSNKSLTLDDFLKFTYQ